MTTVIWRFSDGRPGHDSQSRGLVAALARKRSVEVYQPDIAPGWQAAGWWLSGRFPPGEGLARSPDLLVGAGHATHLPLLAARRRYGGRGVVLMKPSLPPAWFDLCLVPRHDTLAASDKVVLTEGVVNGIRRSAHHQADIGLAIIGGPSRHVRWDNDSMVGQIEALQRRRPKRHWWLATSPRTPAALEARLCRQYPQQCRAFADTDSGWLVQRLAQAGEIWVSRDSVSMLYEALTSGARVGLLEVPVRPQDRVNRAIDRLVAEGWVSTPQQNEPAAGPAQPLDEATRCADWIIEQWLNEN